MKVVIKNVVKKWLLIINRKPYKRAKPSFDVKTANGLILTMKYVTVTSPVAENDLEHSQKLELQRFPNNNAWPVISGYKETGNKYIH